MDYEEIAKGIGRAIKVYRARHDISQEEFALRAGLHRTYVGDLERGERNISLRNLVLIAGALRMRLSELIVEAEEIVESRSD